MLVTSSIIKYLPHSLQKKALKLLYKRNGKEFKSYKSFNNGQFYIYNIDDIYIPSEGLSWYIDFNYYQAWVNNISGYAYKPKLNDIIIDIGSGIGEEMLVFSKMVGKQGKVFSIEANPELIPVLDSLRNLNRLTNVEIFNNAINLIDSSVEISVETDSFIGGNIRDKTSGRKKIYQVPGVRFDSFIELNNINRVNLLKVNIEGAERFVIETMGNCLQKIDNVAISCHDFRFDLESDKNSFFATKSLVMQFFKENGFKIFSQKTGVRHIDDWVYGRRI